MGAARHHLDYQNPPPTGGANQGSVYRQSDAPITDVARPERRRRLTTLEPLTHDAANEGASCLPISKGPQRWGYNVVRLRPETGATSVTVTFRGVVQPEADFGWHWDWSRRTPTSARRATARRQAGARSVQLSTPLPFSG